MRRAPLFAAALFLAACGPLAADPPAPAPLVLSHYELIDHTHSFGADTVYWPTDKKGFRKAVVFEGAREDKRFYSAFSFATAEHGGAHMDAPCHFGAIGLRADDAPLSKSRRTLRRCEGRIAGRNDLHETRLVEPGLCPRRRDAVSPPGAGARRAAGR